jgi:hypothetical protein
MPGGCKTGYVEKLQDLFPRYGFGLIPANRTAGTHKDRRSIGIERKTGGNREMSGKGIFGIVQRSLGTGGNAVPATDAKMGDTLPDLRPLLGIQDEQAQRAYFDTYSISIAFIEIYFYQAHHDNPREFNSKIKAKQLTKSTKKTRSTRRKSCSKRTNLK